MYSHDIRTPQQPAVYGGSLLFKIKWLCAREHPPPHANINPIFFCPACIVSEEKRILKPFFFLFFYIHRFEAGSIKFGEISPKMEPQVSLTRLAGF